MNSLYGKFGQRTEVWEAIEEDAIEEDGVYKYVDTENKKVSYIRIIGGRKEMKVGREISTNSFIAISSEITANARMLLYNLILSAGKENVLYCDTDSLFVNEEGLRRLQNYTGDDLGELKLDKYFESIYIYNLKHYEGIVNNEEIVKLKGVKKNAIRIDENKYKQKQFMRFRGLLKERIFDGVIIKDVIKEVKGKYRKGIVFSDGTIMPFVLHEEEKRYDDVDINELQKEYVKQLKREILKQGGISSSDYENIPGHLKRKRGFSFDVISDILSIDSEELYNILTSNNLKKGG